MEPTLLELKAGETKTVGDLTIANTGGGHKILMPSPTETDGDLPFAELELSTPRTAVTTERVMNPRAPDAGEVTTFDGYTITSVEIGWNGEFAKLRIAKA